MEQKKKKTTQKPSAVPATIEVQHQPRWWKIVFIAMAAAIAVAMPLMSLDAGNSGDEDGWQYPYAKSLYEYYASFGQDTSYLANAEMRYSGWAFDAATMVVVKVFDVDNYMTARHVMNALMGALLMLFVGLLARLIGGWRAGCMALLFIFFSPQIVGHSLNNPKDIPFAACFMGAVYYIAKFITEYPKPTTKTSILLGLMIGATVGIRPGGFLLIPYFGLYVMVYYAIVNRPQHYFSPSNVEVIKKILVRALIALCVMAVVMLLLWPYALRDPLHNIVSSFKTASKYPVILRMVYEGKMIWSDVQPWWYSIKYILITSPIAVLAGVLAYFAVARKYKHGNFWLFVLLFCFAFPLFWMVYSNANVYGGWRHSLFTYSTLAVAAGLGFNAIADLAKNRYAKIALTALPLVLLLHPIIFIVQNHPYEYAYFNRFVGGTKGAFGHYEMDYYYHSTRELSEWIKRDVEQNGAPDSTRKTRVVSWHAASVQYFFRHDTADFSAGFVRWNERGYGNWDYAVFAVTGINPEMLRNTKSFPPKNTAYAVKVDGVPIGIVLKREDWSDFYGHQAMREGNIGEAKAQLQQALAYDPENEQALDDLITIYEQTGMADSALLLAKRWFAFNKGNASAMNHLANLYLNRGDMNNAMLMANAMTKNNSRDISGLWIAANVYARENNSNAALRSLDQLLQLRGNFKPAYQLMAQIYAASGDTQRAKQIMDAMNSIR
jgi:tetratricopeptide (TPR) repeat protein